MFDYVPALTRGRSGINSNNHSPSHDNAHGIVIPFPSVLREAHRLFASLEPQGKQGARHFSRLFTELLPGNVKPSAFLLVGIDQLLGIVGYAIQEELVDRIDPVVVLPGHAYILPFQRSSREMYFPLPSPR